MKRYALKELCDFNQESYSNKDNWEFINYLDTGNVTENKINEIHHFNPLIDKIPSRAKRKVKINDIIFSTVRPNQRHHGIIKEKISNLLVSTGFAVISTKIDIIDSDFLYYYLTQSHIIGSLHIIAEQSMSAYPSIKPSDIGNLELLLPSINIQKAIAKILNKINEKIEINEKINKNLEQQINEIFKSWFVKFEPFKENEFKSSDFGEIPVEWEIDYLGSNKLSKIISSGIQEFEGSKFYVATANVNEDKIDNILPIISYNNRPSRANMQPAPKSAWFAKMKDSRKLIMIDEYSESILVKYIFSTGFCGLKCSKDSFYYIWSFLLSDQLIQ
ncbi:MAG: restriction endonuclease subunit S [Methanobrevibacter sp.]|jgi:type I restriction enzyme S subunit|nr:restriction endonuclease subunit S [Candidatus Methanovirga meridionalis]